MALAFTFIGSTAIATNNFKTEINVNNSDNWELIKEDKGIKIFFKEITGTDGVTFLTIKFENTLSSTVNFKWSVMKGSDAIVKDAENTIAPLSSNETDPATNMISIQKNDSYKNYSINIDLK